MDKLEQLGFLLACIVLVTLGALRVSQQLRPPAPPQAIENGLSPGTDIAPFVHAQFEHTSKNLVLVINSGCHFCSESMSFYRQLSQRRTSGRVSLIAASIEPVDNLQEYLRTNGLAVDATIQHTVSLPLRGTPTLILTNHAGIVERSWLGKLTPIQEKEVLALLAM